VIDRIEPRDDPAFDYREELAALLALWTDELGRGTEPVHAEPRAVGKRGAAT
jgi:hypothetical protein